MQVAIGRVLEKERERGKQVPDAGLLHMLLFSTPKRVVGAGVRKRKKRHRTLVSPNAQHIHIHAQICMYVFEMRMIEFSLPRAQNMVVLSSPSWDP